MLKSGDVAEEDDRAAVLDRRALAEGRHLDEAESVAVGKPAEKQFVLGRQVAQLGARVGRLLELVIDDASQRQRPDDLLLVLQAFLEGGIDAQHLDRADRFDIRSPGALLARKDVDESLLAEQFAGPTESDDLLVGADLDLPADDKPAALDTVTALAD